MADGTDENVDTDRAHFTTQNQTKKRGPYNQYLTEPQLKIPRTTLKRWPKNISTFSEVNDPSNSESAIHLDTTDEQLEVFYTDNDDTSVYNYETDGVLPSLNTEEVITDLPFQPFPDDYKEFRASADEFTGENNDDNNSQMQTEKTIDPLINDENEDQYVHYIDELEENTDNNTNDNESCASDNLLYDGAQISVAVSMLLIITFAIRHSLSGTALVDLLTLISLHCALPNHCASSIALLKTFFMQLKNPIEFHYYCTFCMEYQGTSKDKLCKNKGCLKDLSKKENYSYFIIIPLICQLTELLKKASILELLKYPVTRTKMSPDAIEDIQDGKLYKKHFDKDGYFKGTSKKKKSNEVHISFQLNTDGVALFKSSKYNIWPVYLVVNELPPNCRFTRSNSIFLGLWFGLKKPDFMTFLQPLSQEFQDIYSKGLVVTSDTGKEFTLRGILLSATLDAPAKCLLQNFVQYNGFHGCPYCSEEGITVKTSERGHTLSYPYNRKKLETGFGCERTHAETMENAHKAHASKMMNKYSPVCGVKGYSWLMFIPGFDIINGVAIDYMHGSLLGVMKMLMGLWFDKNHSTEEWSLSRKMDVVDNRLLNIKPLNCITRVPRSISEYTHWKASEFRSFLFFYGIPCLWNILPNEYFQHFLLFVEAIWLLDQHSISPDSLQKAGKLLRHFCLRIEALYGSRYETMNAHCLLHLPDCVRNIGPLWCCSCFWFEDFNGDLRKLFHGSKKVELQIALSVCIHQKIPELIVSLPYGSASKEFYEHMVNRYSLKCKREMISDGIFALGAMTPVSLNATLTSLIEGAVGSQVLRTLSFNRIQINQDIIHSKSYLNVSRRNSCTIDVVKLGLLEVKVFIKFYIKCPNPVFCSNNCSCKIAQYYGISEHLFQPATDVKIAEDQYTHCSPNHLLPVRKRQITAIFPISDVKELCMLVDCKHNDFVFIGRLPNRWEKD